MRRFLITLAVILMLTPANFELPGIEASMFDVNIEQVNFIQVTVVLDGKVKGTE